RTQRCLERVRLSGRGAPRRRLPLLMRLFNKKVKGPAKTLDELVTEAKAFVEGVAPKLEPDEDFIPGVLTDDEIKALVLPGPQLEKELEKRARTPPRFVLW